MNNKFRKFLIITSLVLILGLVFTACTKPGDGDDNKDRKTMEPTPVVTPTKEPEVEKELIWDFETGDMQGFAVVEGKFDKIIADRSESRNNPGTPYPKQGTYYLSTLELENGGYDDSMTGTIVSPVFTLTKPNITFQVGGGMGSKVYVALTLYEEDKEVFKAKGKNSETMYEIEWKADSYVGKKVYIKIVDNETGGWGHITFDNFRATGIIDTIATEEMSKDYDKNRKEIEDKEKKEMFKEIERIKKDLENLNKDNFSNLFEFEKAKAIAISLVDKAEIILKGEMPKGRFSWVDASYTSPKGIIEQAEGILNQLKNSKIPYEGRFAEIGGTVIDHALIEKDGVHHLFYIRGKAATTWPESPTDNFGHAISTDLINWEVKDPILQTTEGEWDGYQVWAPHIIYHNDEYWMFYTGVNYNVAQAIGLAKSKDLYNWERYDKNPVIIPGEWAIWNKDTWSDGRDPCILKDGDTFYAYYCAHTYSEEYKKNIFCIGISSSTDLYNWKDEGYIVLKESIETPPESPYVVKKDDKYYLFYTDYKAGTVFAVSDNPTKGFKDADPSIRTIVPSVSASEIYYSQGKWYISYISHEPNQLHFFEIKELIWNQDGTFSTKEIK